MMIKNIIVAAVAMLSIGISSCTSDSSVSVSQNGGLVSTQTMAMIGTIEVLNKYPDSVADYIKIADALRQIAETDAISKAGIAEHIENAIIKSNSSHKLAMLVGVNLIIDSVFTTDEIDVSVNKQLFLDIANGIEAAIRMHQAVVVTAK